MPRSRSRRRKPKRRVRTQGTIKKVILGSLLTAISLYGIVNIFYWKAKKTRCPVLDELLRFITEPGQRRCYNSAMYVFRDPGAKLFKEVCPGGLVRAPWRRTHQVIGMDGVVTWFERPINFDLECAPSFGIRIGKAKPKQVGVVLLASVRRLENGVPMHYLYLKLERSLSITMTHVAQALKHYTVGKHKQRGLPFLIPRTEKSKPSGLYNEVFPGRMGGEVYFQNY